MVVARLQRHVGVLLSLDPRVLGAGHALVHGLPVRVLEAAVVRVLELEVLVPHIIWRYGVFGFVATLVHAKASSVFDLGEIRGVLHSLGLWSGSAIFIIDLRQPLSLLGSLDVESGSIVRLGQVGVVHTTRSVLRVGRVDVAVADGISSKLGSWYDGVTQIRLMPCISGDIAGVGAAQVVGVVVFNS